MLVSVDAKALEWRCILELSRDAVGIAEVLEGQDTHDLNRIAFSLPSRLIAKIYLFRTIFRGSGWSFANDPDFMHVSADPKYWEAVNEKFFGKYKGIAACHERWREIVMSGQPIVGPLGTFWPIPNRDKKGELYIPWTTLTNFPVQGTGADVMMIARISAFNRAKKLPFSQDVKFIQTIHDSITIDCPSKYVQPVANLFYEVFRDLQQNIKKLFGYDWLVPLEGEVKCGMNATTKWGKDANGKPIIISPLGMEEIAYAA